MHDKSRQTGHGRGLPAILAIGAFLALAWPVILSGFVKGRGAADQLNYHEQVIRTFSEQWPAPDYSDYLSATTPGYHTLLAAFAHYVCDDRRALQIVGSLFTVALLGLLARGVTPRRPGAPSPLGATALLPVVVSMPVFYAGVWLLPDNAGWLGVLALWLLALRPRFDAWTLGAGGAILAALIFVRQIHLWPLAMLLGAAWVGSGPEDDAPFDAAHDLRGLLSGIPVRLARVAGVLVSAAPAIAVLWWFWSVWGGLTPPMFHERHVGGNPSAPAFVLAIFGMYAVFFAPFVLDALRLLWVRHTWLLALALLIGVALAIAPETTYSIEAGRYSGLWNLTRKLPAPLGRSIVIVPLAVLGAGLLAAWFVAMGRRDRWIMLAAMVAFIAAQCASFKLWQRYNEPFVLMWLALAAARVPAARTAAGAGWRGLCPMILSLGLGALTSASLVVARPVAPRTLLAPWETEAPILPGMLGSEGAPGHRDHEPRPNSRSD